MKTLAICLLALMPLLSQFDTFEADKWFEAQQWECSTDTECIEECYEKVEQDETIPEGMVECE